jgi:hypothetical protein
VPARLATYIRGSYPPAFYLPYALLWSLGMTAAFAVTDPRLAGWHIDRGALLTALTVCVILLLVRAADDIRDLEYDREYNQGRPLASGKVQVSDLVVLMGGCAAAGIALNTGRGGALIMLAVFLGYVALLLVLDWKLRWPSGDDVVLSALVSFPIQILLNLYIYASVLRVHALGPSLHALLPMLIALTAFLHLEYARKITRTPRDGERSYVTRYGPEGTAVVAVTAAVISVVIGLVLTRPWAAGDGGSAWGWVLLVPLIFPACGAYRYWRARANRWPVLAAALYLLVSFLAFLVIGLSGARTI